MPSWAAAAMQGEEKAAPAALAPPQVKLEALHQIRAGTAPSADSELLHFGCKLEPLGCF